MWWKRVPDPPLINWKNILKITKSILRLVWRKYSKNVLFKNQNFFLILFSTFLFRSQSDVEKEIN